MAISSFHLQYSGVNAATIAAAGLDLFITEGSPFGLNAAISDIELAQIQATGTLVVGYVNTSVTDDTRSYWQTNWTSNGTDTGTVLAGAPAWLQAQPSNPFGYTVDYTDPAWQQIVINQSVELVSRGYNGVFLDDIGQYFTAGATSGSITDQALAMMQFVIAIDAAIRAVNPDARIITNGLPYIITDATGGSTTVTAQSFLNVIDAMLLESYYGINGPHESAAIAIALANIAPHADLLAVEYGGTAFQNYLFAQEATASGIIPAVAATGAYSTFGDAITGPTNGADILLGTAGDNLIAGLGGADQINGGAGIDTVDFSSSLAGVRVNLLLGTGLFGDAAGDTYINVENISGSGLIDTLYGNNSANGIEGGAGNDLLYGYSGNDVLLGGLGNDYLRGGRGSDTLNGGDGSDTVDYISSTLAGVTVDLSTGATLFGEAQGDTFVSIENLRGSNLNDTLTGTNGNNTLRGVGGNDTLTGLAGRDYFQYNTAAFGTDVITDFTDGIDRLDLRGSGLTAANMVVQLSGGDTVISFTGNAGQSITLDNFVGTFNASDCLF